MANVSASSFTLDRALAMDGASVTGAILVGDNLFLTRRDDTTDDTGSVRGGTGTRQGYRSAYYYGPTGGRAAVAQAFGVMTAVPFMVSGPDPVLFQKIAYRVTSAGGTSAIVKNAIYADNGSGRPGALIIGNPTVDFAGLGYQTGAYEGPYANLSAADMNLTLNPGLYWLASVSQGSTSPAPTLMCAQNNIRSSPGDALLSTATAAAPMIGWTQSGVTGNPPANWTGTGLTANPVALYLKAG
jgi:hypothetical protein